MNGLKKNLLLLAFSFCIATSIQAQVSELKKPLINPDEVFAPEERNEISEGSTSIYFKTDSSKASVYVNEDFYGYTPLEIKNLIPGFYIVRIAKEGFREKDFCIEIKNGFSDNYYFELEKITGFVHFSGLPEGGTISIDGNPLTENPEEKSICLTAGKHYYTASAFGFVPKTELFSVSEDSETEIGISMTEKQLSVKKLKATAKIKGDEVHLQVSAVISKPAKVSFKLKTKNRKEIFSSPEISVTEGNFKTEETIPLNQFPAGSGFELFLTADDGKFPEYTSCELKKFCVK